MPVCATPLSEDPSSHSDQSKEPSFGEFEYDWYLLVKLKAIGASESERNKSFSELSAQVLHLFRGKPPLYGVC